MAEEIANAFVNHYYSTLTQGPDALAGLYVSAAQRAASRTVAATKPPGSRRHAGLCLESVWDSLCFGCIFCLGFGFVRSCRRARAGGSVDAVFRGGGAPGTAGDHCQAQGEKTTFGLPSVMCFSAVMCGLSDAVLLAVCFDGRPSDLARTTLAPWTCSPRPRTTRCSSSSREP